MQTSLQALAPDNRFSGRIRLHNVTPEELGSVVWALTWGGNEGLRHGLGMGKPFGFGQIAIRITNAADSGAVQPNLPTQAGPDLAQCLAAFETFMQTQVPGWDKSATLRELLAMADPTKPQANRSNLSPLELQVGAGNQFVQAKSQRAVLQPYSKLGATDKGR